VSRADAPAIVIGEQVIHPAGRQVPFEFSIPYDPSQIQPQYTYAVQARIEDGARLLFISDRMYPVLTRDAPSRVDMVLRRP
jgi:putative lipoprotein